MNDSSRKIVIEWSDLASPMKSATEADGQRDPVTDGPSGQWCHGRLRHPAARIAIFLLLAFVAMIVVGTALYLAFNRPDWVETIASTADKSVVWIQTKDGIGAGFVIASHENRKLILTNKHVVTVTKGVIFQFEELADQCAVVLRSQTKLTGRLVGLPKDDSIDLALVMVETNMLQPLRIRPFENVDIGEPVVAVGHPDGLDFTITDGRISAKREGVWLQSSAPINHGNSGGPLIDRGGFVVGVNTWKPVDTESIGFAIRADFATDVNAWKCSPEAVDLLEQITH